MAVTVPVALLTRTQSPWPGHGVASGTALCSWRFRRLLCDVLMKKHLGHNQFFKYLAITTFLYWSS